LLAEVAIKESNERGAAFSGSMNDNIAKLKTSA
jgi:hypothetical protein